ncbi:MAG: Flagellum site-determining protein YlxH [Syntrophus sp. SKADARSKE-3]|nr:Flagellum site-determining protein YlxH [Syntrophus sp. SKADARSKE-3]
MKTKSKPLIVSVTSGKGGVGKTFITINLATILARQGKKVLVADCDLGLANIDIMLGINPAQTLKDVVFGSLHLQDVIIPTKGGFDLIPSSSGVREMAQLLFEKIQNIKDMLLEIEGYDLILLDTGAGISEVVLQFNLFAEKNIVVINRELTSLTDAYAIVKVMYQVFSRQSFGIITNNIKDEKEGSNIFKNIDSICQRFLGFPLHYLGYVVQDDAVPKAILKQELAVLAYPNSRINANLAQIGKAILDFKRT